MSLTNYFSYCWVLDSTKIKILTQCREIENIKK